MSRGPGKVQRWVLAELDKPAPGWPPWVTVEALAARYAGLAAGNLMAAVCKDNMWRPMTAISSGYCDMVAPQDPRAYDHLIGLSVESALHGTGSQHLGRSVVESVRRAAKNLAAAGLIDITHLDAAGRGARATRRDERYGNVYMGRGSVAMLACRRLLTEAEKATVAPRVAEVMANAKRAMTMLKAMGGAP